VPLAGGAAAAVRAWVGVRGDRLGGLFLPVTQKWLKDRAGRVLAFEDLADYMDVVGVLVGTIRLMQEIDAAIPSWPLT